MNPWTDSTYWAVGTDAWGDILTWDQCDSREEAEEFIRTELAGRGTQTAQQQENRYPFHNSARRLTDKTNKATKIQPFAEYPCKFPGKDWGTPGKCCRSFPQRFYELFQIVHRTFRKTS